MTEVAPPFALQGGVVSHPALLFRRILSMVSSEGVARFNGVNDLKVTENSSPGMSVFVARGGAYVQGDDVTDQGLYFVYNDATKTLAIAAAHATLARKDVVCAHVKDNFHGQSGDTWVLEVITGTPAASPTEPALPATAVKLAVVDVPAADTAITNSQITDSRAYAGAPISVLLNGSLIGTEPQIDFQGASFNPVDNPGSKRVDVAFSPPVDKEAMYFRQVGTSPIERYYPAGSLSGTTTTFAVASGTFYAMPFFAPRGGTIDRMAFEVTTLSAGNARLGIYNATSDTNLYPSSLVLDAGEVSTGSTGIKSFTISQALAANSLYWFVYLGNATPTLRAFGQVNLFPILGFPASSFATSSGLLTVAQSYGALPSTFPASAAAATSSGPVITARYSA